MATRDIFEQMNDRQLRADAETRARFDALRKRYDEVSPAVARRTTGLRPRCEVMAEAVVTAIEAAKAEGASDGAPVATGADVLAVAFELARVRLARGNASRGNIVRELASLLELTVEG